MPNNVTLLGFDNHADDALAVYGGGSWQVPPETMKSPLVSERCRSTDLDLASTQFTIDLGADRLLKLWCLTHTNLTAAALIKLTWYTAAAEVISVADWTAINGCPAIDPDAIGSAHFHIFNAPPTARSAKCEIDDEANPDGYVELGRNLMLDELGLSRNPDVGADDPVEPNTPFEEADGGTRFHNRKKPKRKYVMGYDVLPAADAPKIRRLRKLCNLDRQVVIIPDPADVANFAERNFVGQLTAMPHLPRLSNGMSAGNGFEILEVV